MKGETDVDSSFRSKLQGLGAKLKELDPRDLSTFKKLFQGYTSNIVYTTPADTIKFVVYDYLKAKLGKGGPGRENKMSICIFPDYTECLTTREFFQAKRQFWEQ